MKYLLKVINNNKFIEIIDFCNTEVISIEVFISFVRISFCNKNCTEEDYIDFGNYL